MSNCGLSLQLERYLRRNKVVRYCRIVIMLAVAGLLLASQIQSNGSYSEDSWSALHCTTIDSVTVDTLSITFIAVWLVFAFTNRILSVCATEASAPVRSWFFEKVMDRLKPLPLGTSRPTNLEILRTRKAITEAEKPFGLIGAYMGLYGFVLREFMSSFAWEISWLIFSSAYGITSTIMSWDNCSQPGEEFESCWGKVLEMGFGQIVPLVLLLLPFFALVESFCKFDMFGLPIPFINYCLDFHGPPEDTEDSIEMANIASNNSSNHEVGHATDHTSPGVKTSPSLSQNSFTKNLYRDIKFIAGGGDPYKTENIRIILFVISLYVVAILSVAGVYSALNGLAGFLIVVILVYITYFLGLAYEIGEIVRAWGEKMASRKKRRQ